MATLLVALMSNCAVAAPAVDDVRIAEGRALAQSLGQSLKQTLQTALAEKGPLGAIDACHLQAPEIAATVSSPGITVGRTALKVRNPANAPDDDARQVLQDFARRLAAGEQPNTIEYFERTPHGARYMKAIATQPMCLTCHGTSVSTDVLQRTKTYYPDDQATGFEAGSLRGAFIVEWKDQP